MHVDEISREKVKEHQNIINELMAKVQEVQYEVNCMNDSRDFKVAESVRSGQLSHVFSESALLGPQADQGGLLSRARNLQPDILDTYGTLANVFASSLRHLVPEYSTHGMTQLQGGFL